MTSPIWHPFTQHGLEEEIPLIDRAQGAVLYTQDGRRIIDAISSWWVNLHGHAHPRIAAAIAAQAARLEQVIFAGFSHAPAEKLAAALSEAAPEGLDGEFRNTQRVLGVIAASRSAGCTLKPSSAVVFTNRGSPPANSTMSG